MPSGYKLLGTPIHLENAGANPITINIAQFAIAEGEAYEVAANPSGLLPPKAQARDGSMRTVMLSIDNTEGTGLIYLTPPDAYPTPPSYETRSLSGNSVAAGTRADIGGLDYATWRQVLRLLPGADAYLSVYFTGPGFRP